MDNELRNGKKEMDEMHKDRPFIQERVSDSMNSLVLLKLVYDHFEKGERLSPHPDAPGHSHRVRGRWDKDGSVCEWCQIWEQVRECLKQNERRIMSNTNDKTGKVSRSLYMGWFD